MIGKLAQPACNALDGRFARLAFHILVAEDTDVGRVQRMRQLDEAARLGELRRAPRRIRLVHVRGAAESDAAQLDGGEPVPNGEVEDREPVPLWTAERRKSDLAALRQRGGERQSGAQPRDAEREGGEEASSLDHDVPPALTSSLGESMDLRVRARGSSIIASPPSTASPMSMVKPVTYAPLVSRR